MPTLSQLEPLLASVSLEISLVEPLNAREPAKV